MWRGVRTVALLGMFITCELTGAVDMNHGARRTHQSVPDSENVSTTETMTLEQILKELPSDRLEHILRNAGYDNVQLGETNNEPASKRQYVERTKAQQCETVVMNAVSHMTHKEASSTGPNPDARTSEFPSFVETNAEEQASADAEGVSHKELDCECETYKCSCRKDCYCSLNDEHFEGTQVVRDATRNALPISNADHQFKCSCSFDGVGGVGLISGGTMNCDCKIADCSCQKQCLCRSKGAGTVSPPRFQQLSADREEVDAVEHLVEDGGQMSILPG